VQVQNKLQLATPLLPQAVQQLGSKVTKSSSSFLLVMAFVSEDGSMGRTTSPTTSRRTSKTRSAGSTVWAR
jgi:multidrug efflux pump subunit AcrB